MELFLLSLGILTASGLLVLLLGSFRTLCHWIFSASLTLACGLIIFVAFLFLRSDGTANFRAPWPVPFGEFSVGLDPLSAFFLITIACVALASGIYGCAYLHSYHGKKNLGVHYFFYLWLIASLVLVVTAKNAILFLVAWEFMAIFAYFLLTFYDEKRSVRRAGQLYLIATHCGTFCLFVMFALMGSSAGSMDFDQMALTHYGPVLTAVLFTLGLIGFGVKAGFFPVHIWLPHAHPAAPSHISALFSGFLIKTGIYGLLRIIFIIKDLPAWSGPVVLVIGAVSGVLGVLYALGQHEIKRLLAYHSIENIGIITLGIGMGLLGNATHHETIALIGYSGALLHVLNHAIFKCLLFLSAGSVIRSTGTGDIDEMGGLLKFLPFTGHLFLIGSLSICGLPLFNGFVSEWLVFRSLFDGVVHLDKFGIILAVMSLVSLALIGGLAAICFAKAFGVIFLGQNRSHANGVYKENPWMMWVPMAFLAVICVWIGLFPKTMVSFSLTSAASFISKEIIPAEMDSLLQPISFFTKVFGVFFLVLSLLILLRFFLIKRYPVRLIGTWACGYELLAPRMQYTASSFAEPILHLFKRVVCFKVHRSEMPLTDFPKELALSSKVVDAPEHFIFSPILVLLKKISRVMLKLQSGYIPQYLFYILFALVALLLWKFPWGK
ncbi:MAG: hydrogenase [Candidatus Omnitrophica bacterium]|nr:hydrogenase [Candidatus Omnitrophota bacterium]